MPNTMKIATKEGATVVTLQVDAEYRWATPAKLDEYLAAGWLPAGADGKPAKDGGVTRHPAGEALIVMAAKKAKAKPKPKPEKVEAVAEVEQSEAEGVTDE